MESKQISYSPLLLLTSILSVAVSHRHPPATESFDCCYSIVGYACFCEVEKETEDYWGYYQPPVTNELYVGDCKCNEISQLSLVLLTTDYAKSITIFDTNNRGNVHCSYSHIHEGQEIICNARDNKLFPDSTSFEIVRSDGSLCNGRIDTTCAGDIIINERDRDCDELVVTGYIGDQGGVCDDGLAPCQCIGRYRRIIKATSSIITGTGSIVEGITSTNTDSSDSDDSANDDSDIDIDSDNDDSDESADSDVGESGTSDSDDEEQSDSIETTDSSDDSDIDGDDSGDNGDNGDSGDDTQSDSIETTDSSDETDIDGDDSDDNGDSDLNDDDDGEDSDDLDENQNSDSNEGDGMIVSPLFAQFLEDRDGADSVGDDEDDSALDNDSNTDIDSDSNDSADDEQSDSIETTDSSDDTDQSNEEDDTVESRDDGTLLIMEPVISINDNGDSQDANDDNQESIDDDLLHIDSDDSNDGLYIENESNESGERNERAMAVPVNVPLVNIVDQNMAKASIYVTMSYYIILLIVLINTLTFSFYFCIRPLSKYCKDNQYFVKYNESNMDYNGCCKQSSKDIIIQSSIDPIDSMDADDDNISSLSDETDEEQA